MTLYTIALFLLAFGASALTQKTLLSRIPAQLFRHRNDNAFRHKKTKARLGSVGIFAGFMACSIIMTSLNIKTPNLIPQGSAEFLTFDAFHFALVLIFLLGLLDDLIGLSATKKLPAEILVASVLFFNGFTLDLGLGPFSSHPVLEYLTTYLLTVLWIVGMTNAINLIDGIDGLAGGLSGLALISFWLIALFNQAEGTSLLLISMLGAVTGFLIFNLHPARIFLGDAGSLMIGLFLAVISLRIPTGPSPTVIIVPMMILFIPLFDLISSFIRRLIAGKSPFQADFGHLHHRLLKRGQSESQTFRQLLAIALVLNTLGITAVLFFDPAFLWMYAGALILASGLLVWFLYLPPPKTVVKAPAHHAGNQEKKRLMSPD